MGPVLGYLDLAQDWNLDVPCYQDDPQTVAGGHHDPGEARHRGGRQETQSGPQHLVDVATRQTAQDVPDEEETGDPGAAVEVDLDGVPRDVACHHLGDGHAGEGQPPARHRGAQGQPHGGQDLAAGRQRNMDDKAYSGSDEWLSYRPSGFAFSAKCQSNIRC